MERCERCAAVGEVDAAGEVQAGGSAGHRLNVAVKYSNVWQRHDRHSCCSARAKA